VKCHLQVDQFEIGIEIEDREDRDWSVKKGFLKLDNCLIILWVVIAASRRRLKNKTGNSYRFTVFGSLRGGVRREGNY